MDGIVGYRLKVGTIADLARLMESYRRETMKILARDYARLVARRAVTDLDLSRLGIAKPHPDVISKASIEAAKLLHERDYVLNGRDLNCKIQFYLVENAVLARFLSGRSEYQRIWDNRKDVIRWNWSFDSKPANISEREWQSRAKLWEAATRKPTLGAGLKFVLIDEELPALGWSGIHRYLPDYETRLTHCVEKLAQSMGKSIPTMRKGEVDSLRQRVKASILEKPTKENFLDPTSTGGISQRAKVSVSVSKPKIEAPGAPKTAMIDHADVILGNDGRTFVAVPHVGMAADTRVFIQLSNNNISISQGGILFGNVTSVPRAAIDHLRMCDTVTLVEIEQAAGRRLLRAKHVAIVKDITMFDTMRPLVGPVRTGRRSQETKEWNSAQ